MGFVYVGNDDHIFLIALAFAFTDSNVFNPLCSTIHSLPWNQNSPIGYICEILYCIFTGDCYFIANGAFLLLLISLCLHHRTFSKMFEHSVQAFDQSNGNRDDHKQLCDLIDFHVSIKSWFLTSAEAYSPYVFYVHIET